MPRFGLFVILLLVVAAPVRGQGFESSNLPILVLETGGREIPNEPKIMARLGIIDNGPGERNRLSDPFNGYDGWVGIELRGASSQSFPKKQFAVETRHEDGTNRNVSLLGLPQENDWVLHAPYSDKSLLRNVLAYEIARRLGHYASRTRWCELVIDGRYWGVYVLMEKIKRDKHRVDIASLGPEENSGDDLTGGYIVKVDKWDGSGNEGWPSRYPPSPAPDRVVHYQYHDPEPDELTEVQKAYIREWIGAFEEVMASDAYADASAGYPALLDVDSFVDYVILNELSRNVDGYRLSAYMYKDKDSNGGRLVMGPAWDYNLAFGNADYYDGSARTGFQVNFAVASDRFQLPFWWGRLVRDPAFSEAVVSRWETLRQGPLHTDSLHAFIDAQVNTLAEAQARNFVRWPVLDVYVWPNAYVGGSYDREITYLKEWIRDRAAWLDERFETINPRSVDVAVPPGELMTGALTPNPASDRVTFAARVGSGQPVRVDVVNALGRRVLTLFEGTWEPQEAYEIAFDVSALPAGVYFVRTVGRSFVETQQLVVVR